MKISSNKCHSVEVAEVATQNFKILQRTPINIFFGGSFKCDKLQRTSEHNIYIGYPVSR